MTQLPVSFPELAEILRSCGPLQAADCTPRELRALIVGQLNVTEPALANRVRQFRQDHMQDLTEYIQLGLKLSGRAASLGGPQSN
jgi:hypothetical protein